MTKKEVRSKKKVKKTLKKSEEIVELEQKIIELTEDVQKIQADFINYKRRSKEGLDDHINASKRQIIMALLPTLDNLQLALAIVPKNLKNNKWAQGVAKSAEQLVDDLRKFGVERIKSLGENFDPKLMDAIDVKGDGKMEIVAEELQSGYLINGDVLRHAVVKVERK